MELFTKKYNSSDFDGFLKEYMQNAYNAVDENNPTRFNCAVSDLTLELKWMVKSNLISPQNAQDIKKYFWRLM